MDLSCCFTGHRPEKLMTPENELMTSLTGAVEEAIRDGFSVFFTGMARGVDIWAAEYVLSKKEEGLPLMLVCCVPYRGFEESWSDLWKAKYRCVTEKADSVRYFFESYNAASFHVRNNWMVTHSQRVIAAFNGFAGGTKNTVEFALRNGVEVVNIL